MDTKRLTVKKEQEVVNNERQVMNNIYYGSMIIDNG